MAGWLGRLRSLCGGWVYELKIRPNSVSVRVEVEVEVEAGLGKKMGWGVKQPSAQ